MTKEKQKILFEKYPSLFVDKDKSPSETCMCWGCECGDGWFDILDETCRKIIEIDKDKKFKFLQVKEKFGGLRLYGIGETDEISNILECAEIESFRTCEHCGSKENVTQRGESWIYTLCNNCFHRMGGNSTSTI